MATSWFNVSKHSARTDIATAVKMLGLLIGQEAKEIAEDDGFVLEEHGNIHCPNTFAACLETLEKLKQVQKMIDEDSFISLKE